MPGQRILRVHRGEQVHKVGEGPVHLLRAGLLGELHARAPHNAQVGLAKRRDLKPENILYDSAKGVLKVVDLGSALQFDSSEISERKRVGTSYYIAPEVLLRNYN